jgi:cytochrome c-type biogenesis protein CcmH/NrfG
MRADYATSDLINKVNSDWINAVLVNPEFGRADAENDVPADDVVVSDLLLLRRQYAQKQTISRWSGPARPSTNSTSADHPERDFAAEPIARPPRPRSVARRVTERLALAVAALAIVGVGVWTAPGAQEVTNAVSVRAANASPEPAAPINMTALRPAWLLPEILYGPAMARSPISAPRPGR